MAQISIEEFCRKTKTRLPEAAKAIKLELFSSTIDDTRVDTGRLKGNWQTSTGEPRLSETLRQDPDGVAAKAEAQNNVTGDGVDYLTNNLPYAEVWEENDGMIARNMARIDTIVKRVSRE